MTSDAHRSPFRRFDSSRVSRVHRIASFRHQLSAGTFELRFQTSTPSSQIFFFSRQGRHIILCRERSCAKDTRFFSLLFIHFDLRLKHKTKMSTSSSSPFSRRTSTRVLALSAAAGIIAASHSSAAPAIGVADAYAFVPPLTKRYRKSFNIARHAYLDDAGAQSPPIPVGRRVPVPNANGRKDTDATATIDESNNNNDDNPTTIYGEITILHPPKSLPNGGRVTLVGSGPGDPDLLTMAAHKVLCDPSNLVIADRLVSAEILDLIEGECRVANKFPGCQHKAQEEIYRWVKEGLEAGKHVVRLKIGDPFVFGRGGEEVLEFRSYGVESTVIPVSCLQWICNRL